MFWLNFYPHNDAYHSTFRALAITRLGKRLPIDVYRILDYFSLFPFDLSMVRQRGLVHKKLADRFEYLRPYKWTANPVSTFLTMREFQDIALQTLKGKRVISEAQYEKGFIEREGIAFGISALSDDVDDYLKSRADVFSYLISLYEENGLTGTHGIKARSGLIPFKYDVKPDVVLD